MGVESAGRCFPWKRILCCHKHTILWPVLLVFLFFVFLNSKIRYIVEDPNYRRLWHMGSVPPRSLSAIASNSDSTPSEQGLGISATTLGIPVETSSSVCEPRKNAVFLKTHKCAGSTVQNVFMRYGNQHNLTFALPRKGNYMGHPAPFDKQFVPDADRFNVTYNLLVHHNRFSFPATQKLMPTDTIYITAVRDPVDLFESMYSYYGLFSFYKMPLERLGLLPKSTPILMKRSGGKFGLNQMLYDLGYPYNEFNNATGVKNYIAWLDNVFSLVMISTRMDESLILLKDIMCWSIDDVVVFKLNARNSRFKTKLSSVARERLKKLNVADQALFEFFSKKLDRQLQAFGKDRMDRELAELQNRTDYWYRSCVSKKELLKKLKTSHQHEANPRVMAYMPTNNTNSNCWALTIPELEFTDHLRSKQKFYQQEADELMKVEEKKQKTVKRVKRTRFGHRH